MQVSTVEVGVAGERLNAEVAISVRASIFRPVLSLSVAYADTSGEAPELFLSSSVNSSGARLRSAVCKLIIYSPARKGACRGKSISPEEAVRPLSNTVRGETS